ncbi:MAG: DNA polymerase III subunit delta' [Gammaproteobacteria bacterium]|nr:DNA polymerase III subunit delta' [Gammaproteobacteria bacterium]
MNRAFPWHAAQWDQWCRAFRRARLGHGWIFSGRAGFGKFEFARACAETVLCESIKADALACGQCRSCQLLRAGNHPDLRLVVPLEDAISIGIDQIRELGEFFSLTAHYGRAKIVIIRPAELMQHAAANALLKILEEPPALGLLILVADAIDRLPPTIRSRCQRLRLDAIDTSLAREWLAREVPSEPAQLDAAFALGNRAPLAAQAAIDADITQSASRIEQLMITVGSGRKHAVQAAQAVHDVAPTLLADCMLNQAHRFALAQLGLAGLSEPQSSQSAPVESLISALNHLHSWQVLAFAARVLEVKTLIVSSANTRDADLLDQLWRTWMLATRPAAGGHPRSQVQENS